jgi:hypothetical protein
MAARQPANMGFCCSMGQETFSLQAGGCFEVDMVNGSLIIYKNIIDICFIIYFQ